MAKSDNGELNNSNLASNNSDPNNSLLQKVTKRVSGLFPSSITKWFGPSDGSTSVIRRRETEDDDDQLQIQQPPKKRAKPTATEVEFNHFQMTSTPLQNSRIQTGGQPLNYTRHTLTSVLYDGPSTSAGARGEPTFNGDDDKSDSGESTSGYSSVLVPQNKEPSFVSGERAASQPTTSKPSSTPSPNKSQNRSLFSEQSLNPQRQCLSARRPSFNSSTFGSPTFVDRTLSTKRAVNSPFYGGRTIYGGASAYKRNRIIFPRDESHTMQVKNSVNIKPVNDITSNNDVCMSKTARRILDTLEHISTPVVDAKKIPNINRQKRLTPYARDAPPKPSNRELIIPSVPDLLKMKQKERLQNSTEQVRKLATTSKSVLNEYSIRTLEDETTKPQKQTHKMMKAKKSKATVPLNDTVDAVQLPDVKLPITNLPKFDFTLPPPPAPTPTQKPTPEVKKSAQSVPVNADGYKFAKPIVVISDMPSIKSINHFKFSEPIDAKITTTSTPSFTFKAESGSTAPRKKDQKVNGQNDVGFCLQPPEKLTGGSVMDVLGKSDPVMEKFKPALGTWECLSCMVRNIPTAIRCVACESLKEPIKKLDPKPSTVNNFGSQFKMTAEKWECGVCMVRNNQSDSACVACTTPNPKTTQKPPTTTTAPPTPSIFGGFGDKFKPATDTWECEACMVRNKSEDGKCVACETPKPGTAASNTSKPTLVMRVAPASSGGFSDFIKKQQTNWECPSCMVRNPPEKKACVCCEGPKPGEKQEFSFGSSGTQFKFGIDKNSTPTPSGFTFGVTATPSTTSSLYGAHPIGNTTYSVPPTTTGFTFGVQPTESQKNTPAVAIAATPTTPAENKSELIAKTTTTTTAAPTFSFGLPKTTQTTPTIVLNGDPKKLFSFGTQSTTITSTSTTKPTNIFSPVVKPAESNSTVSSTVATTTPSTTFSFGTTPKQTNDDNKKTPQFNFGSSSLPFNPVFGSNIAKTTSSFVQPATNFLNTTTQATTFSFKPTTTTATPAVTTTPINNNNKTEVKPFSFTKTETPKFSFNPLSSTATTTTTTTPAPLAKAPVVNFADAAQKPPNSMFSFGAKTDAAKPPSFGGGSVFGQSVQPTTPQNGGFNFGATAVTPNFNFGAAAATTGGTGANSTTPNVFGFGSSQAGSGSATATASAPGVFTFGGGAPAQQPTAAAFTPDIKPNFNFSGGTSIGSFTAQGGPSATMPQRKIRKAVRRTQPR